jgi:hypothetical protein
MSSIFQFFKSCFDESSYQKVTTGTFYNICCSTDVSGAVERPLNGLSCVPVCCTNTVN